MGQRETLEYAIQQISTHPHVLGQDVVDLSVAALRQKLMALPLTEASATTAEQGLAKRYHVTVLTAVLPKTAVSDPGATDWLWTFVHQLIEQWGGQVVQQSPQQCVALFKGEGDCAVGAVRAVGAALALKTELELPLVTRKQVEHPLPEPDNRLDKWQMQVGLHCGIAVDNGENGRFAENQPFHLANWLSNIAPMGTVLLSQEVYEVAGQQFNIDPISLADLLAEKPMVATGVATADNSPSLPQLPKIIYQATEIKPPDFWGSLRNNNVIPHLIGGEGTYTLLQNKFEQVILEQKAHMVTIVGGLGSGKSHLLHHFEQWLTLVPQSVLLLRGRVYAEGMDHWPTPPLGNLLANLLGLQAHDSQAARHHKIYTGLLPYFSGKLLANMTATLKEWLSLEPTQNQPQNPAQWLLTIIKLCQAMVRPTHNQTTNDNGYRPGLQGMVVLLEDLHEADELAINFIEAIFRQCLDRPVLLIGTAQPSLQSKRSSWPTDISAHQHTLLNLAPLSAIEARHLVKLFLPTASTLPLNLYDLLVTSANGNPLYIREAVRLLQLDGRLERMGILWQKAYWRQSELPHLGTPIWPEKSLGLLPKSLPDLFASQLTAVSPMALSVLELAAAVGFQFQDTTLAYLHKRVNNNQSDQSDRLDQHSDITAVLHTLAACGLIRHHLFPIQLGNNSQIYTFNHQLLYEIVRERTAPQKQQQYQEILAEWATL